MNRGEGGWVGGILLGIEKGVGIEGMGFVGGLSI